MRRISTTLCCLLMAVLFLTDTAAWAQTVTVITPTRTGTRSSLLTAAPTPAAVPRAIPPHESKEEIFQRLGGNAPVGAGDGAMQTGPGTLSAPTILAGFEGLDINGFLPPDSDGGIGINHYFEWINIELAIFDRAGNIVVGPVAGNTMFAGMGGPCETTNDGDPIVLFDQLANRWFASQFAVTGGANSLCIAISSGSDPTSSTWFLYEYNFGTVFPDYEKYGIWDDQYTMTFHGFAGGSTYDGLRVGSFDRTAMLASDPTAQLQFYNADATLGGDFFGGLPPRVQGPNNVDPGTTTPFIHMASSEGFGGTDRYTVLEMDVDFATPANTTLTRTDLAAASFDQNLCGFARNCIPQPGTNVGLDSFGGNTLFQAPVRDLDSGAGVDLRLLAQGPVDVNGSDLSGIRWIELQNTGGGWSIRQQSTFAPADGRHRWMGSIAMNGNGDIAMGYSVSDGTSTFPAIWATGRLAGDPLNTMTQGETVLRSGVASQTHSSNRWGDYSVTNVDPTDDLTFWHVNEYITASGTWSTHIAQFRLDPPPPAIDVHVESIATQVLNLGQGNKQGQALVEIRNNTGSPVAGADVTGTFSGAFTGTQTVATNGSGVAEFLTAPKKGNADFSFCVDNVVDVVGGLPYDPNDNGSPSYSCTGGPVNQPPVVSVTNPSNGANFSSGSSVNFTGTAIDNEDGDISAAISWTSSINGNLGNGASITVPLSDGSHTITASATDSGVPTATPETGTDQINITVGSQTETDMTATIVAGTQNAGQGNKRGTATVTVTSNLGNPVSGAAVTVDFGAPFNETHTDNTNGSGVVTLVTNGTARGGQANSFDVCISDVVKAGLTWLQTPGTVCDTPNGPAAGKTLASADVPAVYALERNYPNPFNPTTLIAYSLAEAGPVTLKVYNVLGQEVATLVDGHKESGRHQVVFDASHLSAGVYLYVIEAGPFTATQRMTLFK